MYIYIYIYIYVYLYLYLYACFSSSVLAPARPRGSRVPSAMTPPRRGRAAPRRARRFWDVGLLAAACQLSLLLGRRPPLLVEPPVSQLNARLHRCIIIIIIISIIIVIMMMMMIILLLLIITTFIILHG